MTTMTKHRPNDSLFQRRKTGICDTCWHTMSDHPECSACNILIGSGHMDRIAVTYKNHDVCVSCALSWKGIERELKRPITFEGFAIPNSKAFHKRVREQEGKC